MKATEAFPSAEPTDATVAAESTEPADVTGPADAPEETSPATDLSDDPDSKADTEAPPDDARRKRDRLSTGVLAAVGIVAGGLAFLLGATALIVTSGDTEGLRNELGAVREQLTGLSAQVAEFERKTGRVAELEKALRGSEAARKEAEDMLGGAGKLKATPEILQALNDLEQLAKLPSIDEGDRQRIAEAKARYERDQKKLVYDYDREHRQLRTDRARELARVKKMQAEYAKKLYYQQKALQEAAQKAVAEIYREAQKAEAKRKWEEALLLYQDVASVRIKSAARYVGVSRGRVRGLRAKMEAAAALERAKAKKEAEALGAAKEARARKAQKRIRKVKGKTKGLPDAPPDRGVEVF
ncbi:MAG: hypothetical protein ACYSU0_01110 [Planctomycetota bacterium]